jgi:hypothetical protein
MQMNYKGLLSRHHSAQPFGARNNPKPNLSLNSIKNYIKRSTFVAEDPIITLIPK